MDPPRLAERLLRWWLPRGVVGDSILGDAREELQEYRDRGGLVPPSLWYWLHALRIGAHYAYDPPGRRSDPRADGPRSPSERVRALVHEIRITAQKGREVRVEALFKDLKFGARALFKQPGSALVSVVILALGIGLSTFMFSVIYGVFFRGLDTPQADELRVVNRTDASRPGLDFGLDLPVQDYVDLRERQSSFTDLSGYWSGTINVSGDDGPERFSGAFVTASFLDIVRVQPILGRNVRPEETLPGAPPAAVLGYDLWQDRYGGDPAVLGEAVKINGELGTVVGVMPEGFKFPNNAQLWVGMREDPLATERGEGRFFGVLGRLKPGITEDQALLDLSRIASQLEAEYPDSNEGMGIDLQTVIQSQTGPQLVAIFGAMMGAVILVLLVACANVANLLLSRAALRSREAAVRSAIGGGKLRVMLPFFAEALVLAGAGALLGIGIAFVGVDLFDAATDPALTGKPYWMEFAVDLPILGFVVGLAVLTALAAGAAPALQVARADVSGVLKDESRGSSSFTMGRLTKVLVIGEVALSCALLVGAGLMTKSIVRLSQRDYAFDTEHVFTARVGLFEGDYPDEEARGRFYEDLVPRLAAVPGVRDAALTTALPTNFVGDSRLAFEGRVYDEPTDQPRAHRALVTPGFFDVFGVTLLEGRDFNLLDERGAPPVAIVNASFAEAFFDGQSPLGRRFREGDADEESEWLTVVGVAPDLEMAGFQPGDQPGSDPSGYYVPLSQSDARFVSLAVRPERGEPMAVTADVRGAVQSVDPDLPIYQVQSIGDVIHRNSWFFQVFGVIFIIFGAAALLMASVGLYGVLAFSVSRRITEMGIRMALGAGGRQVMRLVLRQGATQIGIGLALGLALAWGLSAMIRILMFDVEPRDPTVFGAVVLMILGVGLLASWIPARRATRVDPMVALRYE